MKPTAQKAFCGQVANNPDAMPSGAAGQTCDPVCGMVVHPATAKNRVEHDGQTYYFCCGGCKAKFLADPTQFANPTPQSAPSVPSTPSSPVAQGTIYTCPMHPQIRRSEP